MTTLLKKILVVNDEEAIKQVMKMGLVKLGYDFQFFGNIRRGRVSSYFNEFKIASDRRH